MLRETPPCLLFVSSRVGNPARDGLLDSVTRRGTRVVVLVQGLDPTQVMSAAKIPAHGFLDEHDLTSETLSAALEQIALGGNPMPAAMARQLVDLAAHGRPRRTAVLTLREVTVLEHMAAGLSNKCIARELSISPHGVKRHVANIVAKLNSSDRTVAVMTAIEEGILPPPPSPFQGAQAASKA